MQRHITEKDLAVWVVDAGAIAKAAGLGPRINTVMQPCFFALAGVLPADRAIALVKESIEKSYGRRGSQVVERNHRAIDLALANLRRVDGARRRAHAPSVPHDHEPPMSVVAALIGGHGDSLPVSAMSVDGTFATGTAALEKRALAAELPIWDASLCIDCGKCAIVCPHAAIRMKVWDADTPRLRRRASSPRRTAATSCPRARCSPSRSHRTTAPAAASASRCARCATRPTRRTRPSTCSRPTSTATVERPHFEYFLELPEVDRSLVRADTVKGSQLLQPLFEFSGACAGCGETPYLKLVTQLLGDRMVVANATGCSSIYGGNLPTTPWSKDKQGRGPAWANSLFEDNAEFGLGIRLGIERQTKDARRLLATLADELPADLVAALSADPPAVTDEPGIRERRVDVARLREALEGHDDPRATSLVSLADALVPTAVWIVGGDGWAYDIDFGGLDHVLASGRDVNILVLDTEVYSNTGGQASKSTPRGASAKFAATGKGTKKKDLGLLAQAYGDVYVAQIALGANETQTVRAILEAAAWPGPSLILAYSTCIAHGIEMSTSMGHQKDAVSSGYWPLYRFHPSPEEGAHPFSLDSKRPTIPLSDFTHDETRYTSLDRIDHDRSEHLLHLAQADIDERWHYYEQLAGVERRTSTDPDDEVDAGS